MDLAKRWRLLSATYSRKFPVYFAQNVVGEACRLADRYFRAESLESRKAMLLAFDAVLVNAVPKAHAAAAIFSSTRRVMHAEAKTRRVRCRTVVLIPFSAANSHDHIQSTKGLEVSIDAARTLAPGEFGYVAWNTEPGNVICRDSPALVETLRCLGHPADVLYIRGHGGAGEDELGSADQRKRISSSDLVVLLMRGLNRGFQGHIKVYACRSAAAAEGNRSFVQRLADKMHKAGYERCKFHGYTEPLSESRWAATDGDSHKWSGEYRLRASEVRMQVFPRPA